MRMNHNIANTAYRLVAYIDNELIHSVSFFHAADVLSSYVWSSIVVLIRCRTRVSLSQIPYSAESQGSLQSNQHKLMRHSLSVDPMDAVR
jgi:hypothetical protein